ncbi:phosphoribosylanthranilate isomerase [bacterium]|nr:phosphoribosylanthranilate isomerase [bacterium]
MTPIRVKSCCIMSVEEARLAIDAGASALGLVSAMPSGPGVIDESTISAIARMTPPGVTSFLLTSLTSGDELIAQQRRCCAGALQLCRRIDPAHYAVLREELPGIRLVQVLHVESEQSLRDAEAIAPHVDALLLDTGTPSATTPELGGTGRVHDWTISARIRESVDCPVYLAGGLNQENVAEAISIVRPFGVDVCSGVRTSGRLDPEKLRAFLAAAAQLA